MAKSRKKVELGKTYLGVVEDNKDPQKMGRLKIRVLDIYEELPLEDLPWASPWKDLNGNGFNVPDIGKVLIVVFEHADVYKPEFIFSEHFNINLENKVKSLSDPDYLSMKSLLFDHRTQIYVNESEGLKIDHKYNNINIKENSVNINLKDNNRSLNLGDETANQQIILGNNFFSWFDEFITALMTPGASTHIAGIPNPAFISTCMKYQALKTTQFLSHHVNCVNNNLISTVKTTARQDESQLGDNWTSTKEENTLTSKTSENFTPVSGDKPVYDDTYKAPPVEQGVPDNVDMSRFTGTNPETPTGDITTEGITNSAADVSSVTAGATGAASVGSNITDQTTNIASQATGAGTNIAGQASGIGSNIAGQASGIGSNIAGQSTGIGSNIPQLSPESLSVLSNLDANSLSTLSSLDANTLSTLTNLDVNTLTSLSGKNGNSSSSISGNLPPGISPEVLTKIAQLSPEALSTLSGLNPNSISALSGIDISSLGITNATLPTELDINQEQILQAFPGGIPAGVDLNSLTATFKNIPKIPTLPPKNSIKSNPKLDRLMSFLKLKDYVIYDQEMILNIVGIRNIGEEVTNTFDDDLYVFYRNEKQEWEFYEYKITTLPGLLPGTENLPQNVAILRLGQYVDNLSLGLYRDEANHKCLKFETSAVQRNTNLKKYDYTSPTEIGNFPIAIHRSSPTSSAEYVFNYSEGSQVFKSVTQFDQFIRLCEKQVLEGDKDLFTYTLCSKKEFDEKVKISPEIPKLNKAEKFL